MSSALAYVYHYPQPSQLEDGRLTLATCGGTQTEPQFFRGRLLQPYRAAQMLLALSTLSRTRYYMPGHMLARILKAADPVVTCSGDRLRFEAFSVCGGAYARMDLLPQAVEGEWSGRGTTNVDFNDPMRLALSAVLPEAHVQVRVGQDSFALECGPTRVVEKKVKLPERWIKGFSEVQIHQQRLRPWREFKARDLQRFLNALPPIATSYDGAYLVADASGLRLTQSPSEVAVGGPARLRAVTELARLAQHVRIHTSTDGVTAWEWGMADARFHLILSPTLSRGFSGEGQALSSLAAFDQGEVLPRVRAALHWQSRLYASTLAKALGCPQASAEQALTYLASLGLVGYDLADGAFFHRELPFSPELVGKLQPRLKGAKALQEEVDIVSRPGEAIEAYVRSGDVDYHVRRDGEKWRCTCRWQARTQNKQGPCKHVLAVQLRLQ